MKKVIFLLLVSLSAQAGEPTVVSRGALPIGEAVAEALAHSPMLEAAYEDYRAASQRSTQVKAFPEPMLTWTNFAQPIETRTGSQENIFALSQSIPWFGKLRLQESAASHEAEAARLRYESMRLDLTQDIGVTYFDTALLAREKEIVGELSQLLENIRPVVRERIRTGGNLSTELRLDLEVERLRARRDKIEASYVGKVALLHSLMGQKSGRGFDIPPVTNETLKETSFAKLVKPIFEEHPKLLSLDAVVAAAQAREALAKKAGIPDPTIGAAIHDIEGSGNDAVGISIGFRLPLAQKKYRAAREEAAALERAAVARRADAENRLAAKWLGAAAELEAALDTVDRYAKQLIRAANDILETAQSDYESGKGTLVELIDDEKTVLDVRLGYWSAVADAHRAWIVVKTLSANPNL